MPDLPEAIRSAVIATLTFFHFEVNRVRAFAPPALDDFDSTQRLAWEAQVHGERWGGSLRLPRQVKPGEAMLRRGIAFSILVQDHPGHAWLHETLDAFRAYGKLPDLHGQTNPEWHLGPDRIELTHLQALVLRQLEYLSQDITELEDIQSQTLRLGVRFAQSIDFARLVGLALQARRRELEAEALDRKLGGTNGENDDGPGF